MIDHVPLDWLPDLYKRAAWNHPNSHMVNAFDLIAEYRAKCEEIAEDKKRVEEAEAEKNPVLRCTQVKRHLKFTDGEDSGQVVAYNYYSEKDEIMPCPHCRAKDLEDWKKTQVALYGEHSKNPIEVKPSEAVKQILRTEEVYLSASEAKDISDEYNKLVTQLVEDEETWLKLFVFFDEGANRFRHGHTAAILYTADDMRKKIESYQAILAEKSKV